ncbi:MAG: Lrp/AsnC ligand binding domain-containing protein [Nitrosopumilaceae archaeon]
MPIAYILLNVRVNSEMEVIGKLKEILQTGESKYELQGVYGVYDLIVKIETESMESLRNIIAKIRRVDKIYSTVTMLVVEKPEL